MMIEIARRIDHTLLKPDCTNADIRRLCQEAIDYHFHAVCIPPYFAREARQVLGEVSPIRLSVVVGFPMGYAHTFSKVEEIKRAADEEADEMDAVINIAAVKSGNWNYVKNDILSMTRATHLRGKVMKMIVEAGLLTASELKRVCDICEESEVNFVKNATGLSGTDATPEIISTLRQHLSPKVKIKASGGIRTYSATRALIAAGADRIGTSAGILIING
jgi:deoxyribose-phosphate aldolase